MIRAHNKKNTDTIEALFACYGSNYRWWATITVGLGAALTVLMSTSINVAIPSIMGAFGITQDKGQWVSTAFLASSTVTMLLTSWLITRLGARYTFIAALIIFSLGCILAANSPEANILIVSRVIQGAAGGIFLPFAMLILRYVFPIEKQGMAMGLFGIMVAMMPAIGPVLGGILIDAFNWQALFYMTVPFSVVSLVLAIKFLPDRLTTETTKIPLDWVGVVLLSLSFSLLLIAFSDGQSAGWSSQLTLLRFGFSLVLAIAFIGWELRSDHPLLDLTLFEYPGFANAIIITVILGAGLYSSMFTVPLFLQVIQGLSATEAGFVLLPSGLFMALLFPLSGKMADKFSPKILISVGLLLFAFSSYLSVAANIYTPLSLFIFWLIYGRIGLALIFPSLNAITLKGIPTHLLAQASGATNFFRQLGGALGVNLSVVFISQRTSMHVDIITATQDSGNNEMWQNLETLSEPIKSSGIVGLDNLYLGIWAWSKQLYMQALTLGFQDVFFATTFVFILALIPLVFINNKS